MNVFILLLDKDFNSGNEKVLAKCGEFEELEVQEFTNEADAFSDWLNYRKKQYEKQQRMKILQIQCKIQARILPI